jgi:RNA polymerase sigma-32 factor
MIIHRSMYVQEETTQTEPRNIDASMDIKEWEDQGMSTAIRRYDEDKPTALAPRPDDALASYLSQIARTPVLDREEEHALALRYRETHDPAIAARLVGAHLRLVVKLAREYSRTRESLLDLVQEGNLGLVRALGKYDPDRNIRLSTYAAWWIRAYMLKFILDNARLVRFAKNPAQRKLFFNLRKEQQRLTALGISPTAEAIARRLKVPANDVAAMDERLSHAELSLDAPLGDEGERTHLASLEAGPEWQPDLTTERAELRARLRGDLSEFARGLTGRSKVLFEERLLADDPKTLTQLGQRFGLSRERVRQLELKLVGSLRAYLSRRLGDAAEAA